MRGRGNNSQDGNTAQAEGECIISSRPLLSSPRVKLNNLNYGKYNHDSSVLYLVFNYL